MTSSLYFCASFSTRSLSSMWQLLSFSLSSGANRASLVFKHSTHTPRDITHCINPLTPTVVIWNSYKASCVRPAGCKMSFVIFDIRTLWRSALSVRVPGCQKLQMTAYTQRVWHRMLYSCTHMATVGIKDLIDKTGSCSLNTLSQKITIMTYAKADQNWSNHLAYA